MSLSMSNKVISYDLFLPKNSCVEDGEHILPIRFIGFYKSLEYTNVKLRSLNTKDFEHGWC